jgi:putative membrane protein
MGHPRQFSDWRARRRWPDSPCRNREPTVRRAARFPSLNATGSTPPIFESPPLCLTSPMDSPTPAALHTARFNPLIRPYLFWYGAFLLTVSVIGIVALPFWLLGIGQWWSRHYFQKLECELTTRALRFRKGIIVETEKTIPLENIQDVTFVEGPLLRYFNLSILKFETAGHSNGQAHDMQLVGVIEAQQLRHQILEQRQRLLSHRTGTDAPAEGTQEVLVEIRDSLREIVALMRDK